MSVKSVKAKEFLDKPSGNWLWKQKAIEAVELAEQEMFDKAVEVFHTFCKIYTPCKRVDDCPKDCLYVQKFINQLNS